MPILGYHASHEQVDPASLLDAVVHAEQAGFEAADSTLPQLKGK
jgi:hypothetical protein